MRHFLPCSTPATPSRRDPTPEIRLSLTEVAWQFGIPRARLLLAIRNLEIYGERDDFEWVFRWSHLDAWLCAQVGGRS